MHYRPSIRMLLLALVVVTLAPLAGVIVYNTITDSHSALDRARDEARFHAVSVARELSAFVRTSEQVLSRLAGRPQVRAMDPRSCDPIVGDMASLIPFFSNVDIRDARGNSVCSPLSGAVTPDEVVGLPWFQDSMRSGGFAAGNAFRSRHTGRWVSVLAHPVRDPGGMVAGVIGASVDLEQLATRVIHDVPENSTITVFDAEGKFLLRLPDPAEWIGRNARELEKIKKMAREKFEGFDLAMGADDVMRVYSLQPVAGTGWLVSAGIPESVVSAPYRMRILDGAATGLAALVVALALALWVGVFIVVPIHNLSEVCMKVTHGDLLVRAPVQGPPEVANMARQFNEMLDARDRNETQLSRSEQRFALAASTGEIWEADVLSGRTWYSDSFYARLGHAVDEIAAAREAGRQDSLVHVHPDDLEHASAALTAHLERRVPYDVELRIRTMSGDYRWFNAKGQAVWNDEGRPTYMAGVVFDITDRRNLDEQLLHSAKYDSLTGLPNRVLLQDRLEQALIRAKRNGTLVGVLFFDLDRFKEINDSLGHSTGDAVLKEVGSRVRRVLREGDTVARLGGDEFCVVVEECGNRENLAVMARKLHHVLDEPIVADNREIFTNIAIGMTLFPDDGESVEELLKHSDIAMYEAKREGGNTHRFYSRELRAKAADEISMVAGLRRAVERNELELHYQPQIEIKSGRPFGVEALLRWKHPEFGSVPPLDFIHIAEETGLIVPVGEWVLRTACTEVMRWQQAGLPELGLAVNLSARQFRDAGLVGRVADILAATGLNPRRLELEITEGVIMQQTDYTLGVLRRLVELGVRISIDDFGTGYSSLAYLKRFPVHKIKIDHAFVRDIHENRDDSTIVGAIITMAKTLHIGVIAEGVETREQLDYLAALGCNEYQGYYFSRPLPASEIVERMRLEFQNVAGRT